MIDDDIKYALTRHEDVIFLQKALYLANKIRFIDRVMFYIEIIIYLKLIESKKQKNYTDPY